MSSETLHSQARLVQRLQALSSFCGDAQVAAWVRMPHVEGRCIGSAHLHHEKSEEFATTRRSRVGTQTLSVFTLCIEISRHATFKRPSRCNVQRPRRADGDHLTLMIRLQNPTRYRSSRSKFSCLISRC